MENEINETKELGRSKTNPAQSTAPGPAPTSASGNAVAALSLNSIIGSAFEIFKTRFWQLLGTYILMVFQFLILAALILGISAILLIVGNAIPGNVAFTIISLILPFFWAAAILLFITYYDIVSTAIASNFNHLSLYEQISQSYKDTIKYYGIISLRYLAVFGGTILLVIPGLWYMVLTIFTPQIALLQNKPGMNAIYTSRALVKGRFWKALFYALGSAILATLAGGIVDILTNSQIGSFIVGLFIMVISFSIYKHFNAGNETEPQETTESSGIKWATYIFATVGIIVILGIGVGLAAVGKSGFRDLTDGFKDGFTEEMNERESD